MSVAPINFAGLPEDVFTGRVLHTKLGNKDLMNLAHSCRALRAVFLPLAFRILDSDKVSIVALAASEHSRFLYPHIRELHLALNSTEELCTMEYVLEKTACNLKTLSIKESVEVNGLPLSTRAVETCQNLKRLQLSLNRFSMPSEPLDSFERLLFDATGGLKRDLDHS
ncbi:hypothetical protein BC829DRAFT_114523 [Chytridium lagenaria]|nr:hypothetical protein BC829DRAFT_114523 [Chytridium lagenaria]